MRTANGTSNGKKLVAAYAYLRVSGLGQVDGDGFTRQLDAIERYARANGIRVVKVFREEGVCGATDQDGREALSNLMVEMETGDVRLVLFERLDRLARDLMIQESILADFQKRGYELISVTEPDLCSSDPTRTLMRQVLGAFAEYEKKMIVTKLRSARQRMKIKNGRCEGRKPFGAREGEADTLRRMQELRAGGMSFEKIAATLDSEGRKPRESERWSFNSVNSILRAAQYVHRVR